MVRLEGKSDIETADFMDPRRASLSRRAAKIANMRTHVDWITFTIPMIYFGEGTNAYAMAVSNGLEDMFGLELRRLAFGGDWQKQERSRAPYTDAWVQATGGVTLFASPNLTHACIEISGQGCERLLSEGQLHAVLDRAKERVTRIDIACDIETTVKPLQFVMQTSHERMRTSGYVQSDTGETCYVGSQKSERYARVYRYNPPHPRSHLLRIEHVFRKDYAKKVGAAICDGSIEQVAVSAGLAFGWAHEVWNPALVDSADISIVRERGTSGNTIYWLVNSVAPSFKRLCETGAIQDPEKFLREYFLTD